MKTIPQASMAVLLFAMLIMITSGCTRQLKEEVYANPAADFNLLIAGDATAYKDALRGKIIQRYKSGANIHVINIDTLGKISTANFQAILIMDTCLAWTHFNPTVLSFLEQPSVKDRVAWFMTVDDLEERYQHNGVDAITAASIIENQYEVVTQLTQQIDAILSNTP